MPIKQSAKKALRQAKKHAVINTMFKDSYKKAVKEVTKAVEAGEKDLVSKLREAQKRLDKAAKRGVIAKNTAGRKLSRLMAKAKKVAK